MRTLLDNSQQNPDTSFMAGESSSVTETVKRLLNESGLTQYEICKKSGVDKGALSRFLSGNVGLSLASIDKLAAAFGWRLLAEKPPVAAKETPVRRAKRRK